jgi:AmiR/NasT family two-component response regulator
MVLLHHKVAMNKMEQELKTLETLETQTQLARSTKPLLMNQLKRAEEEALDDY